MTMAAATEPKRLDEVVRERTLDAAELEAALKDGGPTEAMREVVQATSTATGAPEWCPMPVGLAIPPGRQVGFLMFRAGWTDTPHKGDRTCVVWSLSEAEEKIAYQRSRGDSMRAVGELAKQMIRVVDGQKANWTMGAGASNVDKFWDEIGRKCCAMIQSYYLKTHTLSQEEQLDFFTNCLVVSTAVAT